MKLTIVLKGGLRSCCSTYSAEFVYESVNGWVNGMCDIEMIDADKGGFRPDDLASLAIEYFGPDAYPFVYVDDVLMSIGRLPDKKKVIALISQESRSGITRDDLEDAAKRSGKIKA